MVSLLQDTLLRKNMEQIYLKQGLPLPDLSAEVVTAHHAACIVASGLGVMIGDPLIAHNLGTNELAVVPLKTDLRHEYAFFEPVNIKRSDNVQKFTDGVKSVTNDFIRTHGY